MALTKTQPILLKMIIYIQVCKNVLYMFGCMISKYHTLDQLKSLIFHAPVVEKWWSAKYVHKLVKEIASNIMQHNGLYVTVMTKSWVVNFFALALTNLGSMRYILYISIDLCDDIYGWSCTQWLLSIYSFFSSRIHSPFSNFVRKSPTGLRQYIHYHDFFDCIWILRVKEEKIGEGKNR